MAARKNVWDLGGDEGPKEIDMWATDADDAVKHDPERYSFEAPDGRAELIDIPGDWADQANSKRRGLAIRLGAPNTIKASEVNAFIEAEIERRASLPPVQEPTREPTE